MRLDRVDGRRAATLGGPYTIRATTLGGPSTIYAGWHNLMMALVLLLLAGTVGADKGVDWTEAADVVRIDGPAVLRVPAAALILGGQTGGSIGVSALAAPLPIGGPKHRVALLITIDLNTIDVTRLEKVDFFVYAVGAAGQVAGSVSQSLALDPERPAGKRGIKILSSIELAPGDYTLRILALEGHRDDYGMRVMSLRVPTLDGRQAALLVPWWLEPLGPWLVALPPGDTSSVIQPLIVDDLMHLPATRPTLEPGTTSIVCLLAHALGSPPWMLSARFAATSSTGIEAPLEIIERRVSQWPELELLLVSVRVPELPRGAYALRVVIQRPETAPLISASLPVMIESGTGVPRLASGITTESPDEAALPKEGKKRRRVRLPLRETSEGYRRVLRLLSAGETMTASQALQELESIAARDAVYDQLEKIESQVLTELAEASLDGLLPVALLHADLVPIYRQHGRAPLAEHALRTSTRLAKLMARQDSAPATRAAAGVALTELAGILLRAGRLVECQGLFELALDVDQDNVTARLGLGFSHERSGAYEATAAVLRPLAKADSSHAEARLRLALNLERLGKTSRSRPLLDALKVPASPDWIALIAAQELVRIAIREQRLEHAAIILGAAFERWPDDPGLRIQQAHLLDHRGKPRQAHAAIARLVAAGAVTPPSPRHRYNRWLADEDASRELRAGADTQLPELGRALDAVAP